MDFSPISKLFRNLIILLVIFILLSIYLGFLKSGAIKSDKIIIPEKRLTITKDNKIDTLYIYKRP